MSNNIPEVFNQLGIPSYKEGVINIKFNKEGLSYKEIILVK